MAPFNFLFFGRKTPEVVLSVSRRKQDDAFPVIKKKAAMNSLEEFGVPSAMYQDACEISEDHFLNNLLSLQNIQLNINGLLDGMLSDELDLKEELEMKDELTSLHSPRSGEAASNHQQRMSDLNKLDPDLVGNVVHGESDIVHGELRTDVLFDDRDQVGKHDSSTSTARTHEISYSIEVEQLISAFAAINLIDGEEPAIPSGIDRNAFQSESASNSKGSCQFTQKRSLEGQSLSLSNLLAHYRGSKRRRLLDGILSDELDLKEELEMKDRLSSLHSPRSGEALIKLEGELIKMEGEIIKMERGLKAELEILEINASNLQRRMPDLSELDPDLVGDVMHGELRTDILLDHGAQVGKHDSSTSMARTHEISYSIEQLISAFAALNLLGGEEPAVRSGINRDAFQSGSVSNSKGSCLFDGILSDELNLKEELEMKDRLSSLHSPSSGEALIKMEGELIKMEKGLKAELEILEINASNLLQRMSDLSEVCMMDCPVMNWI